MIFKSGSHCNVARIMNDTGVYNNAIVIDEDGTNNWHCAAPTNGDMLPEAQTTGLTLMSGTTYQNVWDVPVVLYASALLTPSSTAPYYLMVYLGPSSGFLNQILQAVTPVGGSQHVYPGTLKVPVGWCYSFVMTGTGAGATGAWDGKVFVYEDK